MKVMDNCHTYGPDTVMGTFHPPIHFYEMRPDGTKIDGVNNEELIRVLLHRINYLNNEWMGGKFHCIENSRAFMYLEEALYQLNKRTKDREKRKVEGTHEP